MRVTVYTMDKCGGCTLVKQWLGVNNIDYHLRNISKDGKYIKDVKALGYNSLPLTIIYKDGKRITLDGYQPDEMAKHLL